MRSIRAGALSQCLQPHSTQLFLVLLVNRLVAGNLVHRPLRSIISAFAVGIEVVMILSIAAIMFGMLNGTKTRQSGIGGDMIVHPGAASNLIGQTSASASVKVADVHPSKRFPMSGGRACLHQACRRNFAREHLRHRLRQLSMPLSPSSSSPADLSLTPTTSSSTSSSRPKASTSATPLPGT